MVHARHATVVHTGHAAHIGHGQARRLTQLGNGGFHSFFRSQRCSCIARTAHGLSEDGVGLRLPGADNHIVGFCHADPEFGDIDRLYVIAVCLHNRHIQAGNPNVKIRHRRGVDETQPDALPRFEEAGPVLLRPLAVDQTGKALQVLDIRFHHAHVTPGHPVPDRIHQAIFRNVRKKLTHRLLLAVVVIGYHFQVPHDAVTGVRVFVGQLNHVLTVVTERLTPLGFDDNGTVSTVRLLEAGVAVKPVGTRLLDGKLVGKGFSRLDSGETDTGHAVLIEGKDQPVPVNGGHLIEVIGHIDGNLFAFPEAQNRPGGFAIVADTRFDKVAGIDFYPIDCEAVFPCQADHRQQQSRNACQKGCVHGFDCSQLQNSL